jgi:uroporphyrinogen-III synthase
MLDGSPDLINTSQTVLIGPITAETAGALGVRVDVQAEEQSIEALIRKITVLAENG